ncbi:kinase-like protein [Auriscalpium vulgare]|uniref:Kinase-like protein n=1 Tax=Auriscalpium vulgare TaxID=40419 RepID=A0ACB8RWM7_9AGAM|nr:kinase-like protein [Auriscalpium vulgare]
MLAAATSFFSRSNISQSYSIGASSAGSRTATPTPAGSTSAALPSVAHTPTFQVGLWRVQSATHKVTSKRVSVWTFDKRSPEVDRMTAPAREKTLEVLKAEATSLSRLRHPCILEMVEPLEETRSELIFATEPLLSSLYLAIPGSPYGTSLVDLDEVEIQKGILQLCKGLSFLHTSARTIHSNINPESILINSAGDWKLGGLGLTIPLQGPDGAQTSWEFPTFDRRMSTYTQRSFDYMAPEYALDEVLTTSSDMYSLGCLMYAVHLKGEPPFKNFGNLGSIREHSGRPLNGMDRLDRDLQSMLSSLVTRQPQPRPTPTTLPSLAFFSSLPISTLNFLDRSNFAAKSREEKISFMKGLTSVLERFSEGLRIRKILPTLLEEMKDTHLLPYILPNVFSIAKIISPAQFASLVLPSLKPLFVIKEPPQNMLTLLDNLGTLQSKTEKNVFREHVLPLVYNALESEHAIVQERALQAVPDLCESIDYAEVQGVLFPRVALVFTKTRILSVKVATLVTFLSMIKTLDQSSLTQKLVPLLSKIRTKEPAVTMATLSVQEAMGLKVEREAVATLVLPQLWAMSMGPLLNVDQFQRFMGVIRTLGDRVEKEHNQYLRDSQRIEDRSALAIGGASGPTMGGGVDFESLVGGASVATVKADTEFNGSGWDDDVWGSILAPTPEVGCLRADYCRHSEAIQSPKVQSPSLSASAQASSIPAPATQSLSTSPRIGTTSMPSASFSSAAQGHRSPLGTPSVSMQLLQPSNSNTGGFAPPLQAQAFSQPPPQTRPNYNISLSDVTGLPPMRPAPATPAMAAPSQPAAANSNLSFQALTPSAPPAASPPPFAAQSMGSMLTPLKAQQTTWSGSGTSKPSKDVWGDFDPLA